MDQLTSLILKSQDFVLSTHRNCDGDGLGAELALYYALRKIGKSVSVINVDQTPRRYQFLNPDDNIQYYDSSPHLPEKIDVVLIFDTNDERLVEPLYSALKKKHPALVFVDHHPILKKGPKPPPLSLINTSAASTGEIAFDLIRKLDIPLDVDIARCLYTSLAFDTQLFRFIRSSPNTHLICAELLKFPIAAETIHRHLFGNQTVQKMAYLAKALGQIEYFFEGKVALLRLRDEDLFKYQLEPEESRDVVDMVMNIETLELAALFREETKDIYKLSLRSKGTHEILSVAEAFGGGGHMFAAGATVHGTYADLKTQMVQQLAAVLKMKVPSTSKKTK